MGTSLTLPASRPRGMTYCVGILLAEGLVLASDSRTNAGVDNFATYSKMASFERAGDRVIVLLSSGNLATTQAVISLLRQRGEAGGGAGSDPEADAAPPSLWSARTLFDAVLLISDAVRDIHRRDAPYLESSATAFNASFIVGGQIRGEAPRLFRIYSEGNFIEAGEDTPFLQTGEAKYGKPIIDRVLDPGTTLAEATKCVLVSFDSTMRSNLSVGMPIDLISYERDSLRLSRRRRFLEGDAYVSSLSAGWSAGVRSAFRDLPDLEWD